MKDIIIIGTGKAAFLHFNSYKKIQNIGNIYFVDIKSTSDFFKDIKIYSSILDVIKENSLDIKNLLIDICTPWRAFESVINECVDLGLNNILVEKPFIVNDTYFDKYKNINIMMIQNYLFSDLTIDAKEIIKHRNLKIDSIFTNFSKNRVIDSSKQRGFSNGTSTTIFEIEFPHQIYLANYFLDNRKKNVINYIKTSDLIFDNVTYKHHASVFVIAKKGNKKIVHQGNMTINPIKKSIIILFKNSYVLELNYIIYNSLEVIKPGVLNLYKNNKLIEHKTYEKDDNMYKNISYAYNYFNSAKANKRNIEIIKDFSKEILEYINNLV